MALSISIAVTPSVAATYHSIGQISAVKLPDAMNGTNVWSIEFMVNLFASQADRVAGAQPLQQQRYQVQASPAGTPIQPALYAWLATQSPFVGATDC